MAMSLVDELRLRTRHQNQLELDRLRKERAAMTDENEAAAATDERIAALVEALKPPEKPKPVLSLWHYGVIAGAIAVMVGMGFMAVVAMSNFINAQ
jgi:hypothetical protein